MVAKRVPDDVLRATVAAYEAADGNQVRAAKAMGIPRPTLQTRLRIAARRGLMGTKPVLHGFEITGTSTQMDGEGMVEREWVRQAPAREGEFQVPDGHVIKGVSALVDGQGREIQRWVKTREGAEPGSFAEELVAALNVAKGLAPLVPAPAGADGDTLAVYVIPDAHIGLLAWGKETGRPYDLAIARQILCDAVDDLVGRAPASEEAVVLWLGDTTHQNDRTNMTPRSGHVLDVDGRFQKVLRTAAEIAIRTTQRALERHKRVTVRFIPGNHDPEVALSLTLALSLFYDGQDRVTVDATPGGHFFYRFGKVLIGATHGHTMTPERMAMMLAVDRRQDWGETDFHHMFFGHVHKQSSSEIAGVIVESFNSPAGRDAFAHDGGFRSGRSLVSITFHRDRGETGRHRVNIAPA